jgi:hypothetical protein
MAPALRGAAELARRPANSGGVTVMSARLRWILAMGFSTFVLLGGLALLALGSTEFVPVAWLLVIIGALALAVNAVLRDRLL